MIGTDKLPIRFQSRIVNWELKQAKRDVGMEYFELKLENTGRVTLGLNSIQVETILRFHPKGLRGLLEAKPIVKLVEETLEHLMLEPEGKGPWYELALRDELSHGGVYKHFTLVLAAPKLEGEA